MTPHPAQVCRIGYVVVFVRKWYDAMHFYRELLDLEIIERDDEGGFARFALPEGGPEILVEHLEKTDVPGAVTGSFVGMSMVVRNIAQTYLLWSERAVRFDGPPTRQSWGGILTHFFDPDGNMWSLVEEPSRDESTESSPAHGRALRKFDLEGIDHVALAVRDVRRSAEWYERVLGLERFHEEVWGDFPAIVGVGNTSVALFPVKGNDPKPPPGRDVLAMRHLAFRTDAANFVKAQEALNDAGIEFQYQDHDIAHSIYFRDLDGHEIEITTYDVRR